MRREKTLAVAFLFVACAAAGLVLAVAAAGQDIQIIHSPTLQRVVDKGARSTTQAQIGTAGSQCVLAATGSIFCDGTVNSTGGGTISGATTFNATTTVNGPNTNGQALVVQSTTSSATLHVVNSGAGYGVKSTTGAGSAVHGTGVGAASLGIYGTSDSGIGARGDITTSGTAVYGNAQGTSGNSCACYNTNGSNNAYVLRLQTAGGGELLKAWHSTFLHFLVSNTGDVYATGTITAGAGISAATATFTGVVTMATDAAKIGSTPAVAWNQNVATTYYMLAGTASVANGATTAAVTFTDAFPAALTSITVSPTASYTVFVSATSTTGFTVNLNPASVGGIDVYWMAVGN